MIEKQFGELAEYLQSANYEPATQTQMTNGGVLIRIPDVNLCAGWNHKKVDVLFFAPPGYPAAMPDCFWVEPAGLRLENGATPQNSNDSNPIPGDPVAGRATTWFSWHLQSWNPNKDSLTTYFNVIMQRLKPAR